MLDWSTRPLVSAYFAASDAVRSDYKRDAIAVWALDCDAVAFPFWAPEMSMFKDCYAFRLIDSFKDKGSNMHAQSGCFTVALPMHSESSDNNIPPSLDELIYKRCWLAYGVVGGIMKFPIFRKLELSASEAPKLPELLGIENVTATKLFPSIEGAIRRMADRLYCK